MRFEELAYRVDGLPVTVSSHTRLTVMSLPAWFASVGVAARRASDAIVVDSGAQRRSVSSGERS